MVILKNSLGPAAWSGGPDTPSLCQLCWKTDEQSNDCITLGQGW